jgi:Uma2 family endonuclease
MSILTQPALGASHSTAVIPTEPIFRLSVEQYHKMIRAGILTDDDPVELLEGLLVVKMSKNPPHRVVTGLIREALALLIANNWYVDSQEPVTTDDSEPEPDVVIVRGRRLDYLDRHPGPHEVGLVVEVAEATLARDRSIKKRVYARAGVSVYWLVNLVRKEIEVYTDPALDMDPPDYRQRQKYSRTAAIPVVLDGQEIGVIAVSDIIP